MCQHEIQSLARPIERRHGDLDVDDRAVFGVMLSRAKRSSHLAGSPPPDTVRQVGRIEWRTDVRDGHRQEFFAGIPIAAYGGVVHRFERERIDVEHPRRDR